MSDVVTYKPKYGIVCLVDALGAKNFSEKEVIEFLKSREVIHQALKDKITQQIEVRGIKDPKLAFFNDTIIIAIEVNIDKPGEEYIALKAMGIIVRKLISDGISKRIFFRGAIGIGSFFLDLDKDTVIGQAVADAANWSEMPEMIGCILTPRASMVLEKHRVNDNLPSWIYLDYEAPLKSGKQKMVCINWPKAFFLDEIKPIGCKEGEELKYLYTKISGGVIPKATECKYYNTIDFFKFSHEQSQVNK